MYNYIEGQVVDYGEGFLVLDNQGIGYELSVSSSTLTKAAENRFLRVYTYLAVRDDGISLFGFYSKEEKNMFLKLISVSGIGPKGALAVLSGAELSNLISYIVTGDTKSLSKLKGIGKKTAERIVLELRESIHADIDALPLSDDDAISVGNDKDVEDAVFALRGLGIGRAEALRAVEKCRPQANNLQELITLALRSYK